VGRVGNPVVAQGQGVPLAGEAGQRFGVEVVAGLGAMAGTPELGVPPGQRGKAE
jgi:hypothetical protein